MLERGKNKKRHKKRERISSPPILLSKNYFRLDRC
jgi:hypothetical protein